MTQYFPEPQSQRPLVENPENFSDPPVQMSEVTVRYSDGASVWTPLNNASVMIGPDRVTALLMPTTTDAVVVAQAMMGMIPLASGEVRILGRNVSTMGIKRLARLHSQDVATIMPESELAPTFTVEANIQAHFRMTGRAVDPAWLARVLEMAGIAEHRGTKYGPSSEGRGPHELAVALTGGKLSYPTIVYLDATGSLITAVPGYYSPTQIEPILHYIATEAYKTQDWETFNGSFKSKL